MCTVCVLRRLTPTAIQKMHANHFRKDMLRKILDNAEVAGVKLYYLGDSLAPDSKLVLSDTDNIDDVDIGYPITDGDGVKLLEMIFDLYCIGDSLAEAVVRACSATLNQAQIRLAHDGSRVRYFYSDSDDLAQIPDNFRQFNMCERLEFAMPADLGALVNLVVRDKQSPRFRYIPTVRVVHQTYVEGRVKFPNRATCN